MRLCYDKIAHFDNLITGKSKNRYTLGFKISYFADLMITKIIMFLDNSLSQRKV